MPQGTDTLSPNEDDSAAIEEKMYKFIDAESDTEVTTPTHQQSVIKIKVSTVKESEPRKCCRSCNFFSSFFQKSTPSHLPTTSPPKPSRSSSK